MMRSAVIFDGDDTLWETQPLYNEAKRRFFLEMVDFGFGFSEVEKRFEAIDRTNVTKFGFSKLRFPQSMCDTYRLSCEQRSVPADPGRLSRVRLIGESVFQAIPPLFDGAATTLGALGSAGFVLLLATKGDPEIQEQRIGTSGLRAYFDGVYVLQDKGVGDFARIVSQWSLAIERSWSVGNSPRSDIAPALAVGLNAILIPNLSWVYEEEVFPSSERFYVAASLKDVPSIILG